MLQVTQTAHLLPTRSGEDPDAVREHDILLLPFLPVTLEREVLDDAAFDLAIVQLDERVRFELVLDRGDVERCLARGIGDQDDEGYCSGFSRAAQSGRASDPKVLLPEPRKPLTRSRR